MPLWLILLILLAGCEAQPTAVPLPVGPDPSVLTIATSPEMSPLLGKLAEQFNSQHKGQAGFATIKVAVASPQDMVTAALQANPPYQAINPDSGIWLSKLGAQWGDKFKAEIASPDALPIPRQRYSLPQRFATTPVVIAMWQKTADSFGWPGKPVSWSALQERAAADKTFNWNHPSTAYASGMLATLAEFYAGAGLSRDLTEAIATQDSTLAYVKKVEGTVRFYGEGESAVLDRLKKDGTNLLDAFVAQEQIVLRWNAENASPKLVAVYPVEGTLWADHPLALLETYADYDHFLLSNQQRDTYSAFVRYILDKDAQQTVLSAGYRPVNTSIDLQGAGSPFKGSSAVDALQPKTTLQLPPYSVISVIEDVRDYIKRPTNVILVVDTSGSMGDSAKLPKVKTALVAFINNIKGSQDKLGLVEFGTSVKYNSGLKPATASFRQDVTNHVQSMSADGNTAIYDSVQIALAQLQQLNDTQAINAIVVMTDGQENASIRVSEATLEKNITGSAVPVVVFSIAFGADADPKVMKRLAEITKGQFRQAESINIEELYKIISTYF